MYETLIKISKMKSFYVKHGIHLLDSLPSEAGQFMCNVLKGWSPSHPTIQVWSLNSNWGRLLMVWGSVLCRWRESCSHLNNDLVRNKRLFPGQPAEESSHRSWWHYPGCKWKAHGRLLFQVGGHEGCSLSACWCWPCSLRPTHCEGCSRLLSISPGACTVIT